MDWGGGGLPFRFNFSTAAAASEDHQDTEHGGLKKGYLPPPPPPEEVSSEEVLAAVKTFVTEPVVLQRGLTLLKGRVNSAEVLGVSNTDLVAGKYEGGLKLWECTIDLIETLRREIQDGRLSFRGKRVLELGCGHGLPGILACIKGASAVHFQDFNAAVLKSLTIPNVNANMAHCLAKKKQVTDAQLKEPSLEVRFFAGDWGDVHNLLSVVQSNQPVQLTTEANCPELSFSLSDRDLLMQTDSCTQDIGSTEVKATVHENKCISPADRKKNRVRSGSWSRVCDRATDIGEGEGGYDIILMSETVYSLASLSKLYSLIRRCLRPPYGVVYVAAKKYYFGVGGGSRQFKSVVEEDGVMGAHLVADYADGSSNVREIWKFFFR